MRRAATVLLRLRFTPELTSDSPTEVTASAPAPLRNRRLSNAAGDSAGPATTGRRSSTQNAPSPARAPSTGGTQSPALDPVRVVAAIAPMTARAIVPRIAALNRRRATTPRAAAAMISTIAIPASRTGLSLVPNVSMAKIFSHFGVESMKRFPTAMMGPSTLMTAATSEAKAILTARDRTPAKAPWRRGDMSLSSSLRHEKYW